MDRNTLHYLSDPVTLLQQEAVFGATHLHFKQQAPRNLDIAYGFTADRWQQWVNIAEDLGYVPRRVGRRMWSCRPAGAVQVSFTNKCCRRRICPYCYGRNVIGEAFESILFGLQSYQSWRQVDDLADLDLLVVRVNQGKMSFSSFLTDANQAAFSWKRRNKLHGLYRVSQFLPHGNEIYKHTTLFLLVDRREKFTKSQEGMIRERLRVNRLLTVGKFRDVFAKYVFYPAGLLDLKRVRATVKLLKQCDSMKNLRMTGSAGLFRNQATRTTLKALKTKEGYGKTQKSSNESGGRVERGKSGVRPRRDPSKY